MPQRYSTIDQEKLEMNHVLSKAVVSTMLAAGSLGLVAVATVPTAASAAVVASKAYKGTVKAVNLKKDIFTLTVGRKVYSVHYSVASKWTKGTTADLRAGRAVTVVGRLSGATITATSISA
jgi:L-ribulose-5-phosphate 3-epimerase UlaE